MIRATTFDHVCVVSIKGQEGVREFTHVQSSVTTSVVSSDKQVKFLARREHTNGCKTLTKLSHADVSTVVDVKDFESVREIEVRLEAQGDLLSLNVVFRTDQVPQSIYELILITKVENGLAAWARVAHGLWGGACR